MKRDFFIDCVLYSGNGASVECSKFCYGDGTGERCYKKSKTTKQKESVNICVNVVVFVVLVVAVVVWSRYSAVYACEWQEERNVEKA